MVIKLRTLEPAGTAEVLRAAQRDELMVERIHQETSDLLLKAAGNRVWMKYHGSLPILSKILYAAVTTLADIQTLGEEYTGIIQINSTLRQLPSKKRRLLALLLECFGGIVCERLIAAFKRQLLIPSDLTVEARASLLEGLGALKSTLVFLTRLHKGVFYWGGEYFQLSKRLAGIRYVLVRRWLKDHSTRQGFQLLSTVTMFQLFIYTAISSFRWAQTIPATFPRLKKSLAVSNSSLEEDEPNQSSSGAGAAYYRCSLCLEPRTQDTAAPCGHVFCWSCITEWLQTRAQCPLCRDFVEVSRLIPIQNIARIPRN
ncbi:peroxisome biogenesis factor 10 [Thrips palmi]|uniref:RING-type E3 ubiquitin transferase n=1 Tax=Thrips palmi TaxID=161013 RepID=A0A6P9A7D9_THRPL|nr:peroxisome biogenesis factor 10 [Thrips palmi]